MCQEKKWAFRNLVSVFDFGFGGNQDFVTFDTALDLRFRA